MRARGPLIWTWRFVKRRCEMNRISRTILVSGLSMVAGLTFAAPAMASTSTTAGSSTITQNDDRRHDGIRRGDDDRRRGDNDRRRHRGGRHHGIRFFDNDFRNGHRHGGDDLRIYFDTYRQCERAGEFGEDLDLWDSNDWDCDRTRGGAVLEVDDFDGDNDFRYGGRNYDYDDVNINWFRSLPFFRSW